MIKIQVHIYEEREGVGKSWISKGERDSGDNIKDLTETIDWLQAVLDEIKATK